MSKALKVGLISVGALGICYFIYKKVISKPATATPLKPVAATSSVGTAPATLENLASPSGGCANCSNEELAILNSPTTPQAQDIINQIKGDPNWYDSIVTKSKNKNITVDQQLKLDAVWVLTHP